LRQAAFRSGKKRRENQTILNTAKTFNFLSNEALRHKPKIEGIYETAILQWD